jgi:hypothetical protein
MKYVVTIPEIVLLVVTIVILALFFSIYPITVPWKPVFASPDTAEDYVDIQSDVDSVADKGTHSNFTTQKYTDLINDTLTEADQAPITGNSENFVDDDSSDVDSHADHGTSSNFTTQQYCDNIFDTLTESGQSSTAITNSPSANTGDWINPTNAYADDTNWASSTPSAPVVVSKGTASAVTTATVTPSYPASVQANDIIFILVISHQPVSIGVINLPSGWNEAGQGTYANNVPTNQGRVALFWKRAVGGESGTVSITRTGDTGTDGCFFAQMYQVTGCVTSGNPWDAVVAKYNGNGATTVTWDAVTVSGSGRTLLAFVAQADNVASGTPSGYTQTVTASATNTGTDAELQLFDEKDVFSDGSITATGGQTEGWVTYHISAIPPATSRQHQCSEYGFSIDNGATVTQVRVRLDVKATEDDKIKLEVSSNGGTSYLATTYTSPALTTSEQTIWVDVTSWDTWTTAKLNNNQIWVRVTQVETGTQDTTWLDWIPVEVTYYVSYELDLEFQWTTADPAQTSEYLCIKTGTLNAETLKVDVWNAGGWTNIIASLSASAWNNVSIGTYLTAATITFRFLGGSETSDLTQSSWQIECSLIHVWTQSVNYELELEEQFTDCDYTRTFEELCIYMGAMNGETLSVQWWNSTSNSWLTIIASLSSNQWNNVSVVDYLTSATFTIRFVDGTKENDLSQGTWQKDSCLLHTWTLGYNLNLRVMDLDLTDPIQGAYVYKDSDVKISDVNGWANWTLVSGVVTVQVKYFGFLVNETSINVDGDKTIDVRCNLFDVTVNVKENVRNAKLSNVNVTVYNGTSVGGNKIKSGISNNNGQVTLTNLPNNTLTFIEYGGSIYTLVIGNATQLIGSDDYAFTIVCNQNYVGTTSNYGILVWVGGIVIPLEGSFVTKRLKRKMYKKRKKPK